MKNKTYLLILLFNLSFVAGCAQPTQQNDQTVQHADPFYNVNHNDYPLIHLPLIKPIEADREDGRTPWRVFSYFGPWIHIPNRQGNIYYVYNIEELEKFAVSDGIIMAYSPYINKKADPYILDNYFHWFILVPEKKIAKGFHTEVEFSKYIQSLGIEDPDWQMPDEAYEQFVKTGCLEWIPDCK